MAIGLLLTAGVLAVSVLGDGHGYPVLVRARELVFWALGSYLGIRIFTHLLLDPLLSHWRTSTPGFARDLVVVVLYLSASVFLLHRSVGVNLGTLMSTGAIAAAVVGLSLQETLGNLFAGVSMSLAPAFRVDDWVEVTGNLRGGSGQETFIGRVDAMTWRTVQIITENGDTSIFPNRILAQAVVTNLYAPSGLHRRTLKVTVAPHDTMVATLAAMEQALGGIPHPPDHKPEVRSHSFDMGGVVLEIRFWALGWRDGRAANYQAVRIAQTVLNRMGVPLMGIHGPTPTRTELMVLRDNVLEDLLDRFGLPREWAPELKKGVVLRRSEPGEGVIREGDPGESLFMVMTGTLQAVKVVERFEPYTGLFWEVIGELGPGDWFGEGSLLTGAPRRATVVAATACELVEVPKVAFERILRSAPHLVEGLVELKESRSGHMADLPKAANRRDLARVEIKRWFGL
ncbi:mechanosensitive ion channel family protein [Geothrix sp. SG200]|uniref:mechanosensitive ion channel family protein n=1 Tax=Geothrix sp. SG200 TaxID=2922865 RepID=UPI001FACC097